MATLVLKYGQGDTKPSFRWALSPNRGFKWRLVGVHLDIQASASVGNRRIVAYLSQDVNGPHGPLVCDSGVVTASQAGVGEGGPTKNGYFNSGLAAESVFTEWDVEPTISHDKSITFDQVPGQLLLGGDVYGVVVVVEEMPADSEADSTDGD